ncbi:hypothetical protein H8D30_04855 [bacterium]|nr:hypothetical protein [bacterium]
MGSKKRKKKKKGGSKGILAFLKTFWKKSHFHSTKKGKKGRLPRKRKHRQQDD